MEMSKKKKKSSSRQSTKLQPSSPSLPPSVKRRAIGATLLHVRYIFAWVSFPKFFFFLFLESLFSSFLSLFSSLLSVVLADGSRLVPVFIGRRGRDLNQRRVLQRGRVLHGVVGLKAKAQEL